MQTILDSDIMNSHIFINLLNMSFVASYVILFVIALRFFLKKFPKIFSYMLWSVVAFRLIFPFSIESVYSLLPQKINTAPISRDIGIQPTPQINSGITIVDNSVNEVLNQTVVPATKEINSVNPMQIYESIGMIIWIVGIIFIIFYSVITIVKLKKQLKNATFVEDNIYKVRNLQTPFVYGIIRPTIFLPNNLSEEEEKYIVKHEQIHINRKDYIVKFLGFILLTIYWFNPLVWVAFVLMNKDMEFSCDERVLKELDENIKKSYANSLVSLATDRKVLIGSPVAFGEGNVKQRIKNVLNYRKPKFWAIAMATVLISIVILGLFTNPKNEIANQVRPLTYDEIAKVNKAVQDSNNAYAEYLQKQYNNTNEITIFDNPLLFFLTSYYESPKEMDMGKFTFYIPRESLLTNADQQEYEKLSQFELSMWNVNVEDRVTPIGRVSYDTVETYLKDYMNLSLKDMTNMDKAIYSDEYDCFYNTSSDVYYSDFICSGGTVEGNIITLYSRNTVLTLEKNGEEYFIISYLPLEATNGSDDRIFYMSKLWAEAYINKNGEERYNLMTNEYQEIYYNSLVEINGEEYPWYIRGSSPLVESYEMELTGENYENMLITYKMIDSIPQEYVYQEEVFFKEIDGELYVDNYNVVINNLPKETYDEAIRIQNEVDNGHESWRLDFEAVIYEFAEKNLGYDKIDIISGANNIYKFEASNGDLGEIELYNPLGQSDFGFLSVYKYTANDVQWNLTYEIFPNTDNNKKLRFVFDENDRIIESMEYEESIFPLLTILEQDNIYLYVDKVNRNMIIVKDGEEHIFSLGDISYLTPRWILPEMYYEDFDNDGIKELLIDFYAHSGTGVGIEEIHLIEINNPNKEFYHYFNEDYTNEILSRLSYKIDNEEKTVLVKVDDKSYSYSTFGDVEELTLGSITTFDINKKDIKINVELGFVLKDTDVPQYYDMQYIELDVSYNNGKFGLSNPRFYEK